tara:strand:+ start:1239 stop:1586 length:348 start_codon:yes stop_codon:yes gene_type:complete
MKRKLYPVMGFMLALFTALTFNSCEDVVHEYKGEVTIIDNQGLVMEGVVVTTDVAVQDIHIVGKEGITDSMGLVSFEFDNVAIVKISADLANFHGEGMMVLEEDENVKVTVVVYE